MLGHDGADRTTAHSLIGRRREGFPCARGHANSSPPPLPGLIGLIGHQALDSGARPVEVDFVAVQHLRHNVLALSHETEKDHYRDRLEGLV